MNITTCQIEIVIERYKALLSNDNSDSGIYWGYSSQSLEALTALECESLPDSWEKIHGSSDEQNPEIVLKKIQTIIGGIYMNHLLPTPV